MTPRISSAQAAVALALCGLGTSGIAQPACTAALLADFKVPAEARAACARTFAANPPPPASAESDSLYDALSVISLAAFTRPVTEDLAAARVLVSELQRRHALRPADRRRWRDILLEFGRLDEAAADEAAHPGRSATRLAQAIPLQAAPAPGDARYWRWDVHENRLREQTLPLGTGTHLVVDASPNCHFCPLAAAAIARDPQLARLFRDALWITRPESDFSAASYRRWNESHPAAPLVVVFDVEGWNLPSQWSTPWFRFFRDGREVASVRGWTDHSGAALLAAGRELGLLDDHARPAQAQ